MIPLISIGNLILSLLSSIVTISLCAAYRKSKDEKIGYFLKAFFLFAFTTGLAATPGFIFKNLRSIALIYAIFPFFGFPAVAYFDYIPLEILGWKKAQKIYTWGIMSFAIISTVINISNLGPASVHINGQFVFWEDTNGIIMNILQGSVYTFGLLSFIVFFIINGLRGKESFVRIRSFLLAIGMTFIIFSIIANNLVGASPESYLTTVVGTGFSFIAFAFFIAGIFYKYKPPPKEQV